MTKAAIYIRTYHELPPEIVAKVGEPKARPLDVQERACRAYCERMGYAIFGVYRATAKPSEGVRARWVLQTSINPDQPPEASEWRWVWQYETGGRNHHPYYHVQNLLEAGVIDVIVQFTEGGPSRSMWADVPEDTARRLGRIEYASLWEIEPPTDQERQMHELLTQVGDAESDAERTALMAQVNTLSREIREMKAAREVEAAAAKEPAEVVAALQPAVQKAKQRHIRAVLYCRVLHPDDPFLEEQAEACRVLCEERGFTVVGQFQDTGQVHATGAEADDSAPTGETEALAFIESGRADVLVVYSPDRIVSDRKALDSALARLPLVTFVKPWQERA